MGWSILGKPDVTCCGNSFNYSYEWLLKFYKLNCDKIYFWKSAEIKESQQGFLIGSGVDGEEMT